MNKKLILVLILFVFSIGIMKSMYDYGNPIGYEAYAITESGEKIRLPDEFIHIAWTPQYLIASGFHSFVNALPALTTVTFNVLSTASAGIMSIIGFVSLLFILIKRRFGRDRDPSGMINGGPYKAFGI